MPSKYKSFEKLLRPDPRHGSRLMGKFINCLMIGGKKSIAQAIFYSALDEVASKIKDKEPLDIFTTAISNIKPQVEVRSRRVGGATYQVPVRVAQRRQVSLAFRWLLKATRAKKGRPMARRLAAELLAAYNRDGEAMKKRDDVHRMADANKAFAHLAY